MRRPGKIEDENPCQSEEDALALRLLRARGTVELREAASGSATQGL